MIQRDGRRQNESEGDKRKTMMNRGNVERKKETR
jgi:hypothetical protein